MMKHILKTLLNYVRCNINELMLNPLELDHIEITDCMAQIRDIIHGENIKEKN